jgi:hypothetical protein
MKPANCIALGLALGMAMPYLGLAQGLLARDRSPITSRTINETGPTTSLKRVVPSAPVAIVAPQPPLGEAAEASLPASGPRADPAMDAITTALAADPSMKGAVVTVASDGTSLTLVGSTVDELQRTRAVALATGLAAGTPVISELRVGP